MLFDIVRLLQFHPLYIIAIGANLLKVVFHSNENVSGAAKFSVMKNSLGNLRCHIAPMYNMYK